MTCISLASRKRRYNQATVKDRLKPLKRRVDGPESRPALNSKVGHCVRPNKFVNTDQDEPMARLDVLPAEAVDDPDLREMMQATSREEMFGLYGDHPSLFKSFLDFSFRPRKGADVTQRAAWARARDPTGEKSTSVAGSLSLKHV